MEEYREDEVEFPPKKKVVLSEESMERCRREGLQFRNHIEETSKKMVRWG